MKRKFLDYNASDTPEEIRKCFENYREYLTSVSDRFPAHALDFALADWHYDPQDPRCPHDAWLANLEIKEAPVKTGSSKRSMLIKASFLGAYHDGTITISYTNVQNYSLVKLSATSHFGHSHGDWLMDEMHLTDEGLVGHNIEFANDARWIIYSEDVEYTWTAFDRQNT